MKRLLPILVFGLFGFYLMGANFYAKLGMIDDHEIPLFLGSDGRVNLTEIPRIIKSTEVGRWGEYQRLRPSYFTLRVIETYLWRDNAALWYFARFVMLTLSMYLAYLILNHYFPSIISYLSIFYLLTPTYWSDIWNRLGPSESYAVISVLMFVYGLMKNKIWLITAGYLVATGSKENMLVLFPILLIYAAYNIYYQKASKGEIFTYLLMTLFTLYIVAGIYLGTRFTGGDVYGTSISYKQRLLTLYSYKRYIVATRKAYIPVILGVISTFWLIFYIVKNGIKNTLKQDFIKPFMLMGILVGIIASQFIFYNNQLPSNTRYDFPAMTIFPILELTALKLFLALTLKNKFAFYLKNISYVGVSMLMIFLVFSNGYSPFREKAFANARTSRKFADTLDMVSQTMREQPGATIYFYSENYWDYEPIVSVSRFLTSRGLNNRFELVYSPTKPATDPLGQNLEKIMNGVIEGDGDPDRAFIRFSKTEEQKEPCLGITFGQAAPNSLCPTIAHF